MQSAQGAAQILSAEVMQTVSSDNAGGVDRPPGVLTRVCNGQTNYITITINPFHAAVINLQATPL